MECAVYLIVAVVLAYATLKFIGWLMSAPAICETCEGYGKVPDVSYGMCQCKDCKGTGFLVDTE